MFELIIKLSLAAVIIIYLIWRILYSPRFTNFARHRFIIASLKNNNFEDFMIDQSEKIMVRGRTGYAHWKTFALKKGFGIIVEFDVHPSPLPISMTTSELIHIQDGEHLEQIKRELQQSNDYSSYLAGNEIIQ